MFLVQRPSAATIERFVRDSYDLPLSYGPIGMANGERPGWDVDEATVAIGHGQTDFERAQAALVGWQQFNIGWVETFPPRAPLAVGTCVAVLIRHCGFWSLNGCRVIYLVSRPDDDARFGFAYGTLTNHAESGEEIFEVVVDPATGDVMYRIRAISSPRAMATRVGQPIVRALQARFRRHSAAAMQRATRAQGVSR